MHPEGLGRWIAYPPDHGTRWLGSTKRPDHGLPGFEPAADDLLIEHGEARWLLVAGGEGLHVVAGFALPRAHPKSHREHAAQQTSVVRNEDHALPSDLPFDEGRAPAQRTGRQRRRRVAERFSHPLDGNSGPSGAGRGRGRDRGRRSRAHLHLRAQGVVLGGPRRSRQCSRDRVLRVRGDLETGADPRQGGCSVGFPIPRAGR